jgi:hypothetical protein
VSATPIFDLEEAPPEPPRPWLTIFVAAVLVLVIAPMPILADRHMLPNWHWPGFNGLLLLPALYVARAVHELGHLIAAKLAGMNAGGISVGGLVLMKSGSNWVFHFDRRLLGGFFKPLTSPAGYRSSQYTLMVAGGPLASLGLTAICGAITATHGGGVWNWIGCLFWSSLFTTIISVLPGSSTLNRSDGARLWMLLRHPERTVLWMAVLAIQTEEATGVRPRDWDPRMFELLLSIDPSTPEYPYCQLMAFYRRFDEGLGAAALEHLEQALANSARAGKALRHAVFLEAASTSANIRKQASQARTWCTRACKLRKPDSLHVIEAGIAMCEERYEQAAMHWETARIRVTRRGLDSGLIRLAKEEWAEHEAVCRSALQTKTGEISATSHAVD